jgi:hypothetical protein
MPKSVVNVKVGGKIDVALQFNGKPAPRITWKHNDEPVQLTSRTNTSVTETNEAKLITRDAKRTDSGDYD